MNKIRKCISVLFLFFVIAANADSQKGFSNSFIYYGFITDTGSYYNPDIFIENADNPFIIDSMGKGKIMHVKPLGVRVLEKCFTNETKLITWAANKAEHGYLVSVMENCVISIKQNKPTKKTNFCDTAYLINSPFQERVLCDEDGVALARLISHIFTTSYQIAAGYYILSYGDEYIYSGYLKENNSEYYAKYNPVNEDNKDIFPIIKTKNKNKLYRWIIKEMNKCSIVAVIGDKEGKYIAKSFNKNY